MEFCTEVSKIIEHALAGNKDAVRSYGQLIAEKLKEQGEERQHRIIMRKLDEGYPRGAPAVLDSPGFM